MNRIDRVTAILIQLQSKKVVKAQDIADRFSISLRTVYRDVKTLEEAGIPIIGEPGIGYSIMDGYRLPPVMFTKEEATAFLMAEKLMEKFMDVSTDTNYKAAMYKVRAVLRSVEKDMLENIEEHIHVHQNYTPFNDSSVNDALQPFLKSISEKKVLRMKYKAAYTQEDTEREIEPVGIFYSNGYWHAIAFCRLRNDYRNFRTDRIIHLKQTDVVFDKEHPSLKEFLSKVAQKENVQKIVINIDNRVVHYLREAKYYYGFVSEQQLKTQTQMTFLTNAPDIFVRWYTGFADQAQIITPDSLHDELHRYLEKISIKTPATI